MLWFAFLAIDAHACDLWLTRPAAWLIFRIHKFVEWEPIEMCRESGMRHKITTKGKCLFSRHSDF